MTKIRTKATAVILSASLIAGGLAAVKPVNAETENIADTVTIAVQDNVVQTFSDDVAHLLIWEIAEHSYTADWLFTLIYDRLFRLGSDGNIYPELATEWSIEVEGGGGGEPIDLDVDGLCAPPADEFGMSTGWENGVPGWTDELNNLNHGDSVDFVTAGECNITLRLKLRDDIVFKNGRSFDTGSFCAFIDVTKSLEPYSIVRKTWQPVQSAWVDGDEVVLNLSFEDLSYGFIDFMYNLTTPMASIFDPYSRMWEFDAIGSGAYSIAEMDANGNILLERDEEWWNGVAPTQYIKFLYAPDEQDRLMLLQSGQADIGLLSSLPGGSAENKDDFGDISSMTLSGNPVACLINPNSESLNDLSVRKAVFYSFAIKDRYEADPYQEICGLTTVSSDFWARTNPIYADSQNVKNMLETAGVEERIELELIVNDTDTVGLMTAQTVQTAAAKADIDIVINAMSEGEYNFAIMMNNYDLAIGEIDLIDINSVYTYLNNRISGDFSRVVNVLRSEHEEYNYYTMQYCVQGALVNNAYVSNFGWIPMDLAKTTQISGIKCYEKIVTEDVTAYGANPIGDMSYIDFRHVVKNI